MDAHNVLFDRALTLIHVSYTIIPKEKDSSGNSLRHCQKVVLVEVWCTMLKAML